MGCSGKKSMIGTSSSLFTNFGIGVYQDFMDLLEIKFMKATKSSLEARGGSPAPSSSMVSIQAIAQIQKKKN